MKFIIFLTIFTLNFAQAADEKPSIDRKVFDKEIDLVVSTIKEQKVEKQLLESNELLKACKDKKANDPEAEDVADCVKTQIANMDEATIEKLSKDLDLESFDKKASQNVTSIKDYLSQRIETALRGTPEGKEAKEITLKDMKFVDHAVYSKIYRSQIGKNILLEVTNYCISNFGVKEQPGRVTSSCMVDAECGLGIVNVSIDGNEKPINLSKETIKVKIEDDGNITRTFPTFTADPNDWEQFSEFESCDNMKDSISAKKCDDKTSKSTQLIEELKKAEFALGADFLRAKINFCSMDVVKNMCEVYRCKNVYTSKSDILDESGQGKNSMACIKLLKNFKGFPATRSTIYTANDPSKKIDVSGIKACGLVERLKEYRRVITALDELDKFNKDNKNKAVGMTLSDSKAFKGTYREGEGGKDEKSVEEITTISSNEFSEVKFKDDSEELKKKCFEGGQLANTKECQELALNAIDEKTSNNITAEMEAETEVYLKRVADLKNDQESINEYLKKHGLEKYIDTGLTNDDLVNLISDQYKSERASLKNAMMEKYRALTAPAEGSNGPTIEGIKLQEAEKNVANMEQQKDKIKTLVQYNNIVTSYLSGTLKAEGSTEPGTVQELTYQREIELDNLSGSKDKTAQEEYKNYSQYFKADAATAKGSDRTNFQVDLNFIDTLLGNQKEEEGK